MIWNMAVIEYEGHLVQLNPVYGASIRCHPLHWALPISALQRAWLSGEEGSQSGKHNYSSVWCVLRSVYVQHKEVGSDREEGGCIYSVWSQRRLPKWVFQENQRGGPFPVTGSGCRRLEGLEQSWVCQGTRPDEGSGGGLSHRPGSQRTFCIRLRKWNTFLRCQCPAAKGSRNIPVAEQVCFMTHAEGDTQPGEPWDSSVRRC